MAEDLQGLLEAAVYVGDLDAAEAFYGGTLGLERILRLEGRHVFFRCGGSVLLCFVAEETRKPPGNPDLPVPAHGAEGPGHVCFSVAGPAMDGWRQRLEGAGLEIEADFQWPNGARSIYLRDPAGNSVELAEPKLWFGEG
ncbi:VOC family protein [Marinibacterium profundimaris]|uniref:Bleomycin resistance protein n=1 Tax=Marinibacterium profundimaris TaxID=1679460 RepID=A0A225NL03_9RHOB|nr:VOC family protein [Marinibacterium profundimaris]OWU74633.1 bleomycin resistance protein [Marinibacterium profundimaris]